MVQLLVFAAGLLLAATAVAAGDQEQREARANRDRAAAAMRHFESLKRTQDPEAAVVAILSFRRSVPLSEMVRFVEGCGCEVEAIQRNLGPMQFALGASRAQVLEKGFERRFRENALREMEKSRRDFGSMVDPREPVPANIRHENRLMDADMQAMRAGQWW